MFVLSDFDFRVIFIGNDSHSELGICKTRDFTNFAKYGAASKVGNAHD